MPPDLCNEICRGEIKKTTFTIEFKGKVSGVSEWHPSAKLSKRFRAAETVLGVQMWTVSFVPKIHEWGIKHQVFSY